MSAPPLWITEKAVGIELEELLNVRAVQRLDGAHVEHLARLWRRIGICQLLLDGVPDRARAAWCNAGRAWLDFLAQDPDADRVASRSFAIFDAILARDEATAVAIVRALPPAPESGPDQDDACFVLFGGACVDPQRAASRPALLEQWEGGLGEGDDPRLPVCAALVARDAEQFNDGMALWVNAMVMDNATRAKEGRLDPDVAATEANVSVEGLVILDLAERAGIALTRDYPMLPSIARLVRGVPLPAADAWTRINSYRQFS